jgi:hypothetical protein
MDMTAPAIAPAALLEARGDDEDEEIGPPKLIGEESTPFTATDVTW